MLPKVADMPSPAADGLDGTCISYEVERQVRLDCGHLEIGKYRWPAPVEYVHRTGENVFSVSMALTPRPSFTRVSWLNEPVDLPSEPLGRIAMFNPGSTFRLSVQRGMVRSLYCGIDRDALEQLMDSPIGSDGRRPERNFRLRHSVVELLLNRIYNELSEERFASELAIEGYMRALCVELTRCYQPTEGANGKFHIGGLPPWRLRLVHERIHSDSPAPRLSELAEICGMTVRQLSRAFKVETGKTLGKFISEVTIERASNLLLHTEKPIAEIARQLGDSTSASFTYAFRRETGMLPSELRRRC